MEKKIRQIRSDLRELRKLAHSIESSLAVKETHERRKAYLCSLEQTAEIVQEVERLNRVLASLRIEECIAKSSTLELKYMAAIGSLDRLDKSIILEGYINGKPYWKIGKETGYSERSIQRRANAAIEQLARKI